VLWNEPHPTLTLVTCYPFNAIGPAPRRWIVQADLLAGDAPHAANERAAAGSSPRSRSPRAV